MTTQFLDALLPSGAPEGEAGQTLKMGAALQSAFTMIQTVLTLLHEDGPNARVLLPVPSQWERLQEVAESYSIRTGLKISPRTHGGILVKGYSATALKHAYEVVLANPKRLTMH